MYEWHIFPSTPFSTGLERTGPAYHLLSLARPYPTLALKEIICENYECPVEPPNTATATDKLPSAKACVKHAFDCPCTSVMDVKCLLGKDQQDPNRW